MSPAKCGAVYVLLLLVLLFSLIEGARFFTGSTATVVLNQGAITGLVALALTIPLAAGGYDLSVGSIMSLTAVLGAVLLTEHAVPTWAVILAGVGAGALVGVINGLIVVAAKISSLIGTLATGAIVTAVSVGVSGNRVITGQALSTGFAHDVALQNWHGISIAVAYLVAAMVICGVILEQTKSGRYLYAIGFDPEAARLAGVRVPLLQGMTFVASGALSGFAGIVMMARIASGSPGSGETYLLPAFAAAFLGATQFRGGRFNAWGTVLAVILVGTANYGLLLTSAPQWTPDLFTGLILLIAVGLTGRERQRRLGSRVKPSKWLARWNVFRRPS